jgi:16S rRNA (guanine527-N7)-methyltransferase
MVVQHLLDSLAVLPYLTGYTRLADVGSGGGLPGIPLALARPDLVVTLIESNHKKATFLQQAKIELGLNHVSVYCGRVEDYKPTAPLDAGISRAFAEIALFVRVAGHLVVGDAPLLAMKGVDPLEEIAQLPPGWRVAQTQPLKVPGLDAQRHLISIIRN